MRRAARAASVGLGCVAIACGGCGRPPGDTFEKPPELRPCPAAIGLISDAESGDWASAVRGRDGHWYTFLGTERDPRAELWPRPEVLGGSFETSDGGAAGTAHHARMKGRVGRAKPVGAGMGVSLREPKAPYDASRYGGVSFWARRNPGSTARVRFALPGVQTDPDGMLCEYCFNHYGIDITLAEEWTHYLVPFKALRQEDWGPKDDGLDTSKLYGVEFQVNEENVSFDVSVDELEFTGCPPGVESSERAGTALDAAEPALPAGAGNPLAGLKLWVDPRSSAAVRAKELEAKDARRAALFRQRFAEVPQALWLGGWLEDAGGTVRAVTRSAVERGEVPVFVVHDIPHLDCETTSLGRFGVERAYREFIDDIARGIREGRAIVVLEPFALDAFQRKDCLSPDDREDMYRMLNDALRAFRRSSRIAVYLGTGTTGHSAEGVAAWLAAAGLKNAHGFALNVGGHAKLRELVRFGHAVSARSGGAHFVVDTGQNGGSRTRKDRCDASGLRLGSPPSLATGDPLIDAYLWIQRPGEADGYCPRSPEPGTFWDEAALELAR